MRRELGDDILERNAVQWIIRGMSGHIQTVRAEARRFNHPIVPAVDYDWLEKPIGERTTQRPRGNQSSRAATVIGVNLILLILVLLLLFGGGGFYFGGPAYGGGGLGLVLLICLIVYLMGGFRSKN